LITTLYEKKELIAKNMFKFSNVAVDRYTVYNKEIKMTITQIKNDVILPDNNVWIVGFKSKYPLLKNKYAVINISSLSKAIKIANKKYFTFWENLSSYSFPISESLDLKPENNIANHPEIDFEAGMIEEALGGIE